MRGLQKFYQEIASGSISVKILLAVLNNTAKNKHEWIKNQICASQSPQIWNFLELKSENSSQNYFSGNKNNPSKTKQASKKKVKSIIGVMSTCLLDNLQDDNLINHNNAFFLCHYYLFIPNVIKNTETPEFSYSLTYKDFHFHSSLLLFYPFHPVSC